MSQLTFSRTTRAGDPYANALAGITPLTIDWAPMIEPSPICAPLNTLTLRPSQTRWPTWIGRDGLIRRPDSRSMIEWASLTQKLTPSEIRQLCPIVIGFVSWTKIWPSLAKAL